MAQKTVKKTTTKTAAAKKAPVKKAAPRKTVAKPAVAIEEKATMAPMEKYPCGCDKDCACGGKCGCHGHGGFARFFRKLIVALILFALGFASAKMFCCNHYGPRGPRVQFIDGCMDVESVKCPKLVAALPAMDINQDGCITREEYRAVKKEMRREIREMQVDVVDAE